MLKRSMATDKAVKQQGKRSSQPTVFNIILLSWREGFRGRQVLYDKHISLRPPLARKIKKFIGIVPFRTLSRSALLLLKSLSAAQVCGLEKTYERKRLEHFLYQHLSLFVC